MAPPIVTLTTDFGVRDPYVAAMKGVIRARCPNAIIDDLSHEISPQDILEGALFLAAAAPCYPPGTIHVAVVDPGVGGARRPIVAEISRQIFVCPDNGLLTLLLDAHPLQYAYAIEQPAFLLPGETSATFHGRDIFAAAAGRLAAGACIDAAGPAVHDLTRLRLPQPALEGGDTRGEVIHVDRFGNAITNLRREHLPAGGLRIRAGGLEVPALSRTYADAEIGAPVAVIGGFGFLEIAVRNGSAAGTYHLRPGDAIEVTPSD